MPRPSDLLRRAIQALGLAILAHATDVHPYALEGQVWSGGTAAAPKQVQMALQLQIGPPANRTLLDGSTSWNQVAQAALADWNQYLLRLNLTGVSDTPPPVPTIPSEGNNENVFWGKTVYGEAWNDADSDGAIAVTVRWWVGTQLIEADVVFNSNVNWDSYRGPLLTSAIDLKRVCLHEFGHVLGLNHPDQAGQTVAAIMNSAVSDTDELTNDDVLGAQFLYGARPASLPQITLQPVSQVSLSGGSVTFTVTATGLPLTYQWMKNGVGLSSGGNGPTLTLKNLQPSDFGNYTVVVTNPAGSVTSQVAGLTAGLAIVSPPTAPFVVEGGTMTFTVGAIGTSPITYQWYKGNEPIAGATSATLNYTDPGTISAGPTIPFITVVVTDGTGSITSQSVGYVLSLAINTSGYGNLTFGETGSIMLRASSTVPSFNTPGGVTMTPGGDLFIVDRGNFTLRRISAAGDCTTLAGQPGFQGLWDGSGAGARFSSPGSIAADGAGNVYVVDTNTVRKVTAAGVVTTVAGSGIAGLSFVSAAGIAVDVSGNLYVSDKSANVIYRISPGGSGAVFAGAKGISGTADGLGTAATFNQPQGLAVDASGSLYVADTGNCTVRKISPAGRVRTLAGNPGVAMWGFGVGQAAGFNGPFAIAIDPNGNLFVSERANGIDPTPYVCFEVAPDGTILPNTGTSVGAFGVAVDANDNIYTSSDDTIVETMPTGISYVFAGLEYYPGYADGPIIRYQWRGMPGATSPVLTFSPVPQDLNPYYTLVASSGTSSVSGVVQVVVSGGGVYFPVFTTAPQSQTVAAGTSVVLQAAATWNSYYQWQFNGTNIPGATSPTLTLATVGPQTAGQYTVEAMNNQGMATSTATITVTTDARLTDISARADVGAGADSLIAGFSIGGTGSKSEIIRGVGPTLTTRFSVPGTVSDPELTLFDSNSVAVACDVGWNNAPQMGPSGTLVTAETATGAMMDKVGAFQLAANSADSAMAVVSPTGNFTVGVSSIGNNPGVGLAEVYDADAVPGDSRLTNLSARANIGVGGDIMIGGFVVSGTASETILIRAVGPGLGSTFDLAGVLADPQVELHDGSTVLMATNSGWGKPASKGPSTVQAVFLQATPAVMAELGAFPLSSNSSDCAMLVTLAPGAYTAMVSSRSGGTGIVLLELYELR